jgi:dephospho-CoA kinase
MLIGLTGRIASGKGEVKNYFEKQGFGCYTLSRIVREEAKERGIEITRKHLQDLGNLIREKEDAGAWMRRLIGKINLEDNSIIDGIRNPGEVEELRKLSNSYLISVDAPQELRYKRVLSRAKPSDPKTWNGFLEMDKRDFAEDDPLGQQVGKCMKMADYTIINDSDLEVLNKNIEKIYDKLRC